jgi:hypothetical protein
MKPLPPWPERLLQMILLLLVLGVLIWGFCAAFVPRDA